MRRQKLVAMRLLDVVGFAGFQARPEIAMAIIREDGWLRSTFNFKWPEVGHLIYIEAGQLRVLNCYGSNE